MTCTEVLYEGAPGAVPDHSLQLASPVADVRSPGSDLTALALAAGRGDRDANSEFVRRTCGAVWRACAGWVDPPSADDLTQDTYLRALPSLRCYAGTGSAISWLLTIARRVCAEEIQRRQRCRRIEQRLVDLADGAARDASDRVSLLDALARLPRDRREALVLVAAADLTYEQAADVCGCPVGTIRSRVARARAELVRTWDGLPAAG